MSLNTIRMSKIFLKPSGCSVGPGRSGLTSKCTIWSPSDCLVWVIPNLKNHSMTPYWAVRNQWSTLWQAFYAPEMRKIIRNIIDTHNIQWWHLENVLSAFKIATANRTYSPFEGLGPILRMVARPSKGEYVRFAVATLNALRTFSRCYHCILWLSIVFLMILRISET